MNYGRRSWVLKQSLCAYDLPGQRNVSDGFLEAFVGKENLSAEDHDYLQLLNVYRLAKTPSLKKCLMEKIIEKFDVSNSQGSVKNSHSISVFWIYSRCAIVDFI